jgi:CMP-N-acetylneuraminic acid synthetase
MNVIAIIPARSGSKGVPGKNKMIIDGKPLITYSIEVALESQLLDEIWVSSDDEDICQLAENYEGVNVHKRSEEIAKDASPVSETIYAILELVNIDVDLIVLLQPTSPIRTGLQIDGAIELIINHPEANSLISVIPMDDVHPARMYWKEEDVLHPILDKWEEKRRQEIPLAWYRNGSIYIVRKNAFDVHQTVMIKPSIGFEMPFDEWLNIDSARDVLIAKALIPAWKKGDLT